MKSTRLYDLRRAALLPVLLLGLPVCAQSFVFSNAVPRAVPRRANIILIVANGLGYGDLSCDGQTNFQTPSLDKLAAEGIRFTNYTTGAAAAPPAWAALMLGKDATHLRQRADVNVALAPDDTTVAQVLKKAGYYTGFVGEWNLGGETTGGAPWKQGVDDFAGYFNARDAANFYADYIFRYMPRSVLNKTNHQMEPFIGRETFVPNLGGAKGEYIPDLFRKVALNFIKFNQPDPYNHYRPFFLVLNFNIPGNGRSEVPTDAPYSGEPWPQAARNRAAMIARLDGYVAQLQQQLEKYKLTDNTAIFFTSATVPPKNGAVSPEFFHSVSSTNSLRVPMIVKWPAEIAAGQVSGYKWSAEDFLPTAAAIAYTKPPAGINGRPVLPVLGNLAKK